MTSGMGGTSMKPCATQWSFLSFIYGLYPFHFYSHSLSSFCSLPHSFSFTSSSSSLTFSTSSSLHFSLTLTLIIHSPNLLPERVLKYLMRNVDENLKRKDVGQRVRVRVRVRVGYPKSCSWRLMCAVKILDKGTTESEGQLPQRDRLWVMATVLVLCSILNFFPFLFIIIIP